MHYIDLHIHSKYSRATSKNMDIPHLSASALQKGVSLLGTGDFTHSKWLSELKNILQPFSEGIYAYKNTYFLLSVEVSNIYFKAGKSRKVHNVILAPNFDVVEQINEYFSQYGELDSDGRPILNLDSEYMVKDLHKISSDIEVIPAHIWTPWFGVLGSKSGFDSITACYGSASKYIHALETGLSSDPLMNYMLSALDKYNLVSFSDAHSYYSWRLGRELTMVKEITYSEVLSAIRTGKGLLGTIELDPREGKYYWDGHRNCNVGISPKKFNELGGICPVCKKPLTKGVLHRVYELADRKYGYIPPGKPNFYHSIPLALILSKLYDIKTLPSKKIDSIYSALISNLGSELDILFRVPLSKISVVNEKLANVISLLRSDNLNISPGYDGKYGEIIL